jgi:hypothetical protein
MPRRGRGHLRGVGGYPQNRQTGVNGFMPAAQTRIEAFQREG